VIFAGRDLRDEVLRVEGLRVCRLMDFGVSRFEVLRFCWVCGLRFEGL
jgi:hypothetical protein